MLRFERTINTIDAHTEGEPLRITTSGIPPLPGDTILEKRRYMRENYDQLRKLLMLEPRGHSGMYGCIVTPPTTEDGDFGVVFMHNEGYSTMCGHGIIGVTKVALETGMIELAPNTNLVRIDSPAGRVIARANFEGGRVRSVSFENVPSFVFARDVTVPVEGLGEVQVDICFGGAFYAFVEAEQLGVRVTPEHMDRLVKVGMELKYRVMGQLNVVHPLEPELHGIYGTIITEPVQQQGSKLISKNVTIFADAQIDRSPTGTGTTARTALLHEQGIMDEETPLVNRSVIDTVFEGRIVDFTTVGEYEAVCTEVTGTAQLMGFNQLVLDPDDPLPEGFRITGG